MAKLYSYHTKDLTMAELELLYLASKGLNQKMIADQVFLSDRTVQAHLQRIVIKLNCGNIAGAVAYALRKKLIP